MGDLQGMNGARPSVRPIEDAKVSGVARHVERAAGGVVGLAPVGRLPGEPGPIDLPIEVVQSGQGVLSLAPTGGLVREAVKEHRRMIHVAQIHLTQHLLRDAAVHRDTEGRRRVVIQRDLLPDRVAQAVGQHQKQGIRRMMVRADQLDVRRVGLVQEDQDVIRRHNRATARPAVGSRIDALIVEGDTRVLDRVAVEEQPRRFGIDRDAAEAEGLEELVDAPLLPEDRHLEDVEGRRLRRPEVSAVE